MKFFVENFMKMRVFEGFHIFWTRSTEINSNVRFMINIFIVLSLSFWHLHFCISRKMLKNAPTLANGGVDTAESRWKFKKSQKCEEYMKIHENRIPKSVRGRSAIFCTLSDLQRRWNFGSKISWKCVFLMKIHENRIPKSVEDCRIRRAYVQNFKLKTRREMKDIK